MQTSSNDIENIFQIKSSKQQQQSKVIINPSLLACDLGSIDSELHSIVDLQDCGNGVQ